MEWPSIGRQFSTASNLTAREFLRRRGMLTFMVLVPVSTYLLLYLALPEGRASLEAMENGVAVQLELDQRDFFGGFTGLSFVALLAGVAGFYLLQSALRADRRLILAGYAPVALVAARVLVLLLIDLGITLLMVLLMLLFTVPRQIPAYVLAMFWAAMIYSFYGGLTGVLVRNELGGLIAVVFLANIDIGYLQVPGYSNVLDEWWARLLPGYFPVQLAIDAAFTSRLELLWSSFWSLPQGLVVMGVMLAAYERGTHIHPFLPEQRPGRRALRLALLLGAALVIGGAAWAAYRYYDSRPDVVEADGRVSAPGAQVVSLLSGRIRELSLVEGQDVVRDQVVAWVEDPVTGLALPVRAPMAGRVTGVPVRTGENVLQGSTLATIHDLARVEVKLEVEETVIGKVAVGQPVELRVGSLGEVLTGEVREIAQQALPAEAGVTERSRRVRKYAVTVALPGIDSRLRLGLAVHGTVLAGPPVASAADAGR